MRRRIKERFQFRQDRGTYRVQIQYRGKRISFDFPGDITKPWKRELEDLFDEFEKTNRCGHELSREALVTLGKLREREATKYQRLLTEGLFSESSSDPVDTITLKQAFEGYMARFSNQRTKTNWVNFSKNIMEHLGEDTPMARITVAEFDNLFNVVLRNEKAYATLHKYRVDLRSLWRHYHEVAAGISHNVLANPKAFRLHKAKKDSLAATKPTIDDEWFLNALESVPDPEMKALFAYYRWTGARFSDPIQDAWELVNLSEVDPRLTRHDAKRHRMIERLPIHPGLRRELLAYRDSLLVSGKMPSGRLFPRLGRVSNATVRHYFQKHMARNGVRVWPQFFNTLRATFSRELRRNFGNAAEAYFVGHSEQVADKHYDQFQSSDSDRMRQAFSEWKPVLRIHDNDLPGQENQAS
jgi:hypothetical protein